MAFNCNQPEGFCDHGVRCLDGIEAGDNVVHETLEAARKKFRELRGPP